MMPADTSLSRSTWRAQRVPVAALLLFLLPLLLLPQPVIAAPLQRPSADQVYVHVVRAGETLASIAASYGISVQDLRASNNLVNRAELVSCAPNNDSTQARGTVRLNGQPANGIRVVFSWRPDGQVVARAISGAGGQEGGQFSHILLASGPREGNWWFWVENDAGNRISEMAYVHTDRLPHEGMCQRAVLDFDIRSLDFTYIGRRLHIPVSAQLLVTSQPVVTAPLKRPSAHKVYGHIVRHGESLASIATSYDISVQELREFNSLANRAELVRCDPNGINTQVRGTVRRNGSPVNDYRVVFSWQPDGEVVARRTSGEGGQYTHILHGAGPREGNWWFWIENEDEQRISEMGYVHTDPDPHTGKCQWAVIDFDIQNPDLIYIGRRLNIPVAG